MSVELVTNEIVKFLGRKNPEVLCIRGKWGVGKTYAWTKRLKDALAAQAVALPRYSYVSLFGIRVYPLDAGNAKSSKVIRSPLPGKRPQI